MAFEMCSRPAEMTDPSDALAGHTYVRGPFATTDLHAGGVLFCVIYLDCLEFGADGRLRRYCEVLDESMRLDDEGDELRAKEATGRWRWEGGQLHCELGDLVLVGAASTERRDLIAFHGWNGAGGESLAFRRRAADELSVR